MNELPKAAFPNPVTPQGVARFAIAKFGWLLLWQCVIAFFASGTVVWFCFKNYVPIATAFVQQLPESANLEKGRVVGVENEILADGKFLSIATSISGNRQSGTADVQLVFRQNTLNICSLFGCASLVYPQQKIPLGRSVSEPWLGAWQPAILAGIAIGSFLHFLISWWIFALVYLWLAKVTAYFTDRPISISGAWKLSCGAQLPAAILMTLAIVFYGLQALDFVRFLILFGLHFVLSWVVVLIAPIFLPRVAEKETPKTSNPFQ